MEEPLRGAVLTDSSASLGMTVFCSLCFPFCIHFFKLSALSTQARCLSYFVASISDPKSAWEKKLPLCITCEPAYFGRNGEGGQN